jgi:hypothetical protein
MKKKNYNDIIDDLFLDIDLPTDDDIRYETKATKVSLAHKGRTHSEQTKSKWSKIKIGHKRDKNSVKKSIEGSKETKWLQLLEKYSKKLIQKAIKLHGNHQNNICSELKCGIRTLRKLCKEYKIDIPKQSKEEKQNWAKTTQSNPILVWKCGKREPYKPIGKPTEYYSVSECIRQFELKGINLHKGNLLRNEKNNTPYNGYFFKKIKK